MQSSVKTSLPAAFILSMRPKQWTKNLLIFMALFFTINQAGDVAELGAGLRLLAKAGIAFILFCLLSGVAYVVNDILDRENDRIHPTKRFRPIASGNLSTPVALVVSSTIGVLAIAASYVLEPLFGLVAMLYLAALLLYSFYFKRIPIVDVLSISAGFIMRAVAGAVVLQLPISPWLYICTGFGALFVALAKRRSELAFAGEQASKQRDSLGAYTLPILDQLISIVTPAAIVSYTLYTVTADNLPDNYAMLLTVPFVVYGLFRYLFIVQRYGLGETPEDVLFSDAPLLIAVGLWLVTAAGVLIAFRV